TNPAVIASITFSTYRTFRIPKSRPKKTSISALSFFSRTLVHGGRVRLLGGDPFFSPGSQRGRAHRCSRSLSGGNRVRNSEQPRSVKKGSAAASDGVPHSDREQCAVKRRSFQ